MTDSPCHLAPRHDPDLKGYCRWCHTQVAEPWFMQRRPEPAEMVAEMVRRGGGHISHATAKAVADALLGWADTVHEVSEHLPRQIWADDRYREAILARLRTRLLEKVASEGRIPTALPSQAIRYLAQSTFGLGNGSEVPAKYAQAGADYEEVQIILAVACRTPEIDRAAAVRAGIL